MSKWMMVGCAWITLVASAAHAAPAPSAPAKPSADEQKRYGAALKHAREAEAAGKLAVAAKAFEDCLKIIADDPVALGELGVVQLRANQLADAEATSRKAVAHATTVNVHAAALFNLGYILAKKGDNPGAIEAYQGSLRLRANQTVEAALRKLDPKAADSLRFVPRAMTASAATSGAALAKAQCKKDLDGDEQLPPGTKPEDTYEHHYDCTEFPAKLALTGTPFLEVKVLHEVGSYNSQREVDTLAIRTQNGWFVTPFESLWSNRWGTSTGKIAAVELTAIGAGKAIVVRWTQDVDDWPWDATKHYPDDGLEGRQEIMTFIAIAGVGPSGVPAMTPAIPVGMAAGYGDDRVRGASAELAVAFPAAGGLALTGPTLAPTKTPKIKYADLLALLKPGTFPLDFP
ncbi:MAG TPA: tetratricopeptide repeat protein [Kofleriaceae bacterium]|nr:tetratricopeptide repeat protein [Kofleriaceae bacterium]